MAESYPSRAGNGKIIQVLGSMALIVACLYWTRSILIPLTLAVLLTFILAPLVTRLQRRGLGKGWAITIVVLAAFTLLGGLCWGTILQLGNLLNEIPQHRNEIEVKVKMLQGWGGQSMSEFVQMFRDLGGKLDGDRAAEGTESAQPVRVVNGATSSWAWVAELIGASLNVVLSGLFMALLVVFMLAKREDLRNRFFQAVGRRQLAVMTRAVDEAAERISRFLMTQLFVNLSFGLLWSLCLFFVPNGEGGRGVPYALLWGIAAALLRFVPYVGVWFGLLCPLLLSIALSPLGHPWLQPVIMIAIFAVLEAFVGNVLEPILYGHHAGVSPVALLVAAVFWTWLWGPIGLLLSTPLTVCLVVLGKYIPGLGLLHVFLGPDSAVETETSYYQRLLVWDEDEATELVQAHLEKQPLDTVYDDVLLPALILGARDEEQGNLEPGVDRFIVEVTQRVVEEIVGQAQRLQREKDGERPLGTRPKQKEKVTVVGCPARGPADEVALAMLGQLLEQADYALEIIPGQTVAADLINRVREEEPAVVCIASLPKGGLAQADYLCRRLRSHFPKLKIVVGRWGQKDNIEKTVARLKSAGATSIVTTLLETQEEILGKPAAPATTAANQEVKGRAAVSV